MKIADLQEILDYLDGPSRRANSVIDRCSTNHEEHFVGVLVRDLRRSLVKVSDLIDQRLLEERPKVQGRPLKEGDRVRLLLTKEVMMSEFGHGEYGTVASINEDDGFTKIHLDVYHKSLDTWGNCFLFHDKNILYRGPDVREQLEIITECTHQFSHETNHVTGERHCTTCYETGMFDSVCPRWLLADRVTESVEKRFSPPHLGLIAATWGLIDTLTNYQLKNQFAESVTFCLTELHKQGYKQDVK